MSKNNNPLDDDDEVIEWIKNIKYSDVKDKHREWYYGHLFKNLLRRIEKLEQEVRNKNLNR